MRKKERTHQGVMCEVRAKCREEMRAKTRPEKTLHQCTINYSASVSQGHQMKRCSSLLCKTVNYDTRDIGSGHRTASIV